jgi:hypothetical protein
MVADNGGLTSGPLAPQTALMAARLVRDEGVAGSNPATPTK